MKIQVLLSTFNGEQYLSAQLDSILSQDCAAEVSVLIRDDGSSDGTKNILEEYSENSSFQVNFGENVGVERSIMWLLAHRDRGCDLFALCDQDDVWYPNKLTEAISALAGMDPEMPSLFASRSEIVDKDLVHISDSPFPEKGVSFYHAMVQNACPGHTQVLNDTLAELILKTADTSSIVVIDWWIYLIASGLGNVVFLPQPLVAHRQHGSNAVGYADSRRKLWRQKITRFFGGHSTRVAGQLESFRRQFGSLLPQAYLEELNSFLDSRGSAAQRIRYLRHCRVYRNNRGDTRSMKLLYAIGKFNDCAF